jgi:glutathione S-transferase
MTDSVVMVLYAPQISMFSRTCSTIAEEAGISWRLEATGTGTQEAAQHHPFLRTPAATIEGHHFYETVAITSFIDSQYNQRRLQPAAPEAGARCLQWINVASNYVFPILEERLVLPRIVAPLMGRAPDEEMIKQALPNIAYHLQVVEARLNEVPFLAGPEVSLADIFMYCNIDAALMTAEGREMISHLPAMQAWFDIIAARPACRATKWPTPEEMGA